MPKRERLWSSVSAGMGLSVCLCLCLSVPLVIDSSQKAVVVQNCVSRSVVSDSL